MSDDYLMYKINYSIYRSKIDLKHVMYCCIYSKRLRLQKRNHRNNIHYRLYFTALAVVQPSAKSRLANAFHEFCTDTDKLPLPQCKHLPLPLVTKWMQGKHLKK